MVNINDLDNYFDQLSSRINNCAKKMTEKNTGHVFISHSSADKQFVRSLAAQLKARNIPVWLDEEELLPGSNWQEAITRAIRDASVIIVVVSENSVSSSWQNVEILEHGNVTCRPISNRYQTSDSYSPEP